MRILSALALFALAAPALAQEAAPVTAEAAKPEKPAKKKDDPDRKICRRLQSSSSRLGGPTECHTKAEWDQLRGDTSRRTDANVRSQ